MAPRHDADGTKERMGTKKPVSGFNRGPCLITELTHQVTSKLLLKVISPGRVPESDL